GRFAIGGQSKMASLTGAAYTVEVAEPLGVGRRGILSIRVAKDRPGLVRGPGGAFRASDRTQAVAKVTVDSTPEDGPMVSFDPWDGLTKTTAKAGRGESHLIRK